MKLGQVTCISKWKKKKIIMFYGQGCPDSERMIKELDEKGVPNEITIDRLEVWNNTNNEKIREKYYDLLKKAAEEYDGKQRVTIVPSFVDIKGKRALCNPTYEGLIKWLRK